MSRRKAEEMIRAGRVTLDGKVAVLGDRGDANEATIAIDGVPIPVHPGLAYYLLYKPVGVVSTAADPQGRPTVVDLVAAPTRVYPVGRLDLESEGLLLLTNDGTLTELLTHPRYGVTKTYVVRVAGSLRPADLRKLEEGIELEDGPARAVSARQLDSHGDETLVEIVMAEGRKREVRRMLAALGHPVSRLVRVAIGPLRDAKLKPGSSRVLSPSEIQSLYAAAGATWEDAPTMRNLGQ